MSHYATATARQEWRERHDSPTVAYALLLTESSAIATVESRVETRGDAAAPVSHYLQAEVSCASASSATAAAPARSRLSRSPLDIITCAGGASCGVPLNDACLNSGAELCRAHVRVSRNHQPVEG